MTYVSPGEAPASGGRNIRLVLLKGVLTLGLLVVLGLRLDWTDLATRLGGASPWGFITALVLVTAAVPLWAVRWRLLAARAGATLSFGLALQLNFAGLFFGQVLPASVGGDVVRAWLARRAGLDWPPVISSVVLDRIVALAAAVILIVCSAPWLLDRGAGALAWTALLAVAIVVALVAGLFVDCLPWPARFVSWRAVAAIFELVRRARAAFVSPAGLAALAISVLIHLTTVAAVVALGVSLGLDASTMLTPSLLVVPTALVAAAVPVSLNGWGVREGVMVAGFALFGIAEGDAFLVSVLLGLAVVGSALPGGLTWLMLR